ncbi:hypothetical protein SGGMMB4_04293 [Sodalis glossinidius str. 'morsitans']|uniref:Uncharacterized protein n=1 Tax=Sodalis glossinidius (strain morsitans) TaxID=343509 RepID=A0A193QLK9_SODGM|nr:hypothetical protein SGGMMB4_04293 [Sodalis glossinidius str. 'morsitans']
MRKQTISFIALIYLSWPRLIEVNTAMRKMLHSVMKEYLRMSG